MIRPNEKKHEQTESGENNYESFLSVFRHLHRRHVADEPRIRLCLFLRDPGSAIADRSSLKFLHRIFGNDLQQLLLLP